MYWYNGNKRKILTKSKIGQIRKLLGSDKKIQSQKLLDNGWIQNTYKNGQVFKFKLTLSSENLKKLYTN